MQSILSYGRFITRAFVSGIYYTTSSGQSAPSSPLSTSPSHNQAPIDKKLKFVTAISGFSKIVALDKIRPGKFGDDAYFIATQSSGDVIGVADGVGGWREWGIDPGEFSYNLMQICEQLVTADVVDPCEPDVILAIAYRELLKNNRHILGSSTACLVVLQGSFGRLSSANIGDSGFLVVRKGSVVHRSQEQTHHFNTPFQLALPPPGSGRVLSDRPESAAKQEFIVEPGDVLLVATDGVFDNLPDSLIIDELLKVADLTDCIQLQKAANAIAQQARTHAFDEQYMSPFALNARKNGYKEVRGGKPDDITVILASVIG